MIGSYPLNNLPEKCRGITGVGVQKDRIVRSSDADGDDNLLTCTNYMKEKIKQTDENM